MLNLQENKTWLKYSSDPFLLIYLFCWVQWGLGFCCLSLRIFPWLKRSTSSGAEYPPSSMETDWRAVRPSFVLFRLLVAVSAQIGRYDSSGPTGFTFLLFHRPLDGGRNLSIKFPVASPQRILLYLKVNLRPDSIKSIAVESVDF